MEREVIALVAVGLAISVVSGLVASAIARSKGRGGAPHFFSGFFLPLVVIVAAGSMAPATAADMQPPG